jgi:DNA topoisomerase-1
VQRIVDLQMIRQFEGFGMPPAYPWAYFNLNQTQQIRAIGIDARGRKQYKYDQTTSQNHADEKFARLYHFIDAIPNMRRDVDKQIKTIPTVGYTMETVTAMAIHLMDVGHFRIGNETYREERDSYGVSNLTPHHLSKVWNEHGATVIHIAFKGKSGVLNELDLPWSQSFTKQLWNLAQQAIAWNSQHLFCWLSRDSGHATQTSKASSEICLRAQHINDFISKYGNFSAKDFRTYAANVLLLDRVIPASLQATEAAIKQRKQVLAQYVKQVASLLHHTPSNAKKSYMFPPILGAFVAHPEQLVQLTRISATNKGTRDSLYDDDMAVILRVILKQWMREN